MRVPYSWLHEHIDDLPALERVTELLDGIGLGVEAVHQAPAPPAGVITVTITSAEAIEGSTSLQRCQVSDGSTSYQVVCGAPNARAGMVAALATVGTRLPDGMQIATREVMGVPSEGMLCSAKELGLFDHSAGIMAFAEDTPLGVELRELWQGDSIIELEVTPNRADCFSWLGVARDLVAKLGSHMRHPAVDVAPADSQADTGLRVSIETATCDRFTLRRIEGITVQPSPVWLQRRLAQLGARPKNTIVDITNYVTFELGTPSHAYDLRALADNALTVRNAQEGETFEALDGSTYQLSAADTVISSGGKVIGLAGVMGGLHDSVRQTEADSPATRAIALEVAHFDPVAVRKTAKRLGISSDASYRFERGVDPNMPPRASARIAALIQQLVPGAVIPDAMLDTGSDVQPATIDFAPSRVAFLLATDIPEAMQQLYLERLGCAVERCAPDHWRVTPPSWRVDMHIPEDVMDELARLHGFEHIPSTVPHMDFVPPLHDSTHRQLRQRLAAMGLRELISYVFSSPEALAQVHAPAATVQLANPQGLETSVLRSALYPSLLYASARNHQQPNLALFEIGGVFTEDGEHERLAILLRGDWLASPWQASASQPVDFYVLKGLLEQLAQGMGAHLTLSPPASPHPALHPNVAASVQWQGETVGMAGQLHPQIAQGLELPPTFIAELRLPLAAPTLAFRDIARQPHAERDIAIVSPRRVPYQQLAAIVHAHAGESLESLTPIDSYEGERLESGMRSLTVRLRFRHPQRTLTDSELEQTMHQVVAGLQQKGYSIRQ